MAHPSTGSLRILRAAVLGSAAFALALSAHVAAGGRAPSLAFAWVLVIACGGVSFGLTSRRLGPAAISTTLGVFQLGLHYSFMWLSSGACVAGSPAGIAPIHEHGGHAQGLSCVPMAAGMSAVGQVPTAMLGAHVVATVATAFAPRSRRTGAVADVFCGLDCVSRGWTGSDSACETAFGALAHCGGWRCPGGVGWDWPTGSAGVRALRLRPPSPSPPPPTSAAGAHSHSLP